MWCEGMHLCVFTEQNIVQTELQKELGIEGQQLNWINVFFRSFLARIVNSVCG